MSVMIQLQGKEGYAVGIMNRESGKSEERIEFICPGEKRILEDLDKLTIYKDGISQNEKYDDWTPILVITSYSIHYTKLYEMMLMLDTLPSLWFLSNLAVSRPVV